jgi:hypothetical protein
MDLPAGRRAAALLAVPATLALGLLAPSPPPAAAATTPTVTVASPTQGAKVAAGAVRFSGSTTAGADTLTTSVMFVVDSSASAVAARVRGTDCNGDGVFTPGAAGAGDDLNGDGSEGDVLDCEIGAVQALNRGLANLAGASTVQVGIEAFSGTAATASFDANGAVPFVPSTALTDGGSSRVDAVARSVREHSIGLYQPKQLTGGTNFAAAVDTALSALAGQPAGPKWVVLLSDGTDTVSDATLTQLARSNVHLRSFAIGQDASCSKVRTLWKLANATGDGCVPVPDQASLRASAIASQPQGIAHVDVAVAGRSVTADVDPFGGWSARLTLPAGSYTATVTATSPAGRVYAAAPRSFRVVASTSARRTVRPRLVVDTPAATYASLPARVTGRATYRDPGTRQTVLLNGVRVALQARTVVHGRTHWGTVATAKVARGRYALRWSVRRQARSLRVVLSPVAGVSGAVAAVPHPLVYGCSIRHAGRTSWVTTCHTTAPRGSKAQLRSSRVLARGTVSRAHTIRLVTRRDPHRLALVVARAHARSVTLRLPARG